MPKRHTPLVIGLAEYVDFPDWRIRQLRAKVDTGARSSALHVENIDEFSPGRVRFEVRLHRSDARRRVAVEAKIVRRGKVRASTGVLEPRLFVSARVRLGAVVREIEIGLVDRRNMIYRMLLGRSAIERHFLVDVARRYLLQAPAPTFSRSARG